MAKLYTKNSAIRPATRYETSAAVEAKSAPYGCPIELTIDVIGGKWKSVILWRINKFKDPLRFGELRKLIPQLTPRMLSRQLRELESHGVVFRDVYPVVPPRVAYGLTRRGRTLVPILRSMCDWGVRNGWGGKKS